MSSKVERLEARVSSLEQELRQLKATLDGSKSGPWYRQIVGTFADNRAYAEISKLGRDIRKAGRRRTR
jgi:hypothetical protein